MPEDKYHYTSFSSAGSDALRLKTPAVFGMAAKRDLD